MARLLLDTHILLWANSEPERLNASTVDALENRTNELLVSSISAAEIEIKRSIGKLAMPHTCDALLRAIDAHWLDLTGRHAMALRDLPAIHRDPFDRLLIAQATTESLVLVSADVNVLAYPIETLRAAG